MARQSIVPSLWFDGDAEEAAAFYVAAFPRSRVVTTSRYGEGAVRPAGTARAVEVELDGQVLVLLDGGAAGRFAEAVSLQVRCKNQDELDALWAALAVGGREGRAGWLTDRYGLSWQLVPQDLAGFLRGLDAARAQRVGEALRAAGRIDMEALRAAAR